MILMKMRMMRCVCGSRIIEFIMDLKYKKNIFFCGRSRGGLIGTLDRMR